MRKRGRRCLILRHLVVAAGAFALMASIADAARAATGTSGLAGLWTLSSNKSRNQCRMVLRAENAFAGHALSLPPPCLRAAPSLAPVKAWTSPDADVVSLDDGDGVPVAAFTRQATGAFQAGDEATEILTLTPLQPRAAAEDKASGSIVTLNTSGAPAVTAVEATRQVTAVAVPAALAREKTAGEVAGNYAVLRGDRDTGCMVVLDPMREAGGMLKARLAPACRDAGIMIFDPLGWQLQTGGLVLKARKGHTIRMEPKDDKTWVKIPEDVKALGLKRL